MKKVFFAAIAVCGFVAANAQTSATSSPNPTALAGPVTSTAAISVTLMNAIQITPAPGVNTYGSDGPQQQFLNAADYNAGAKYIGFESWNIKSTRAGSASIVVSDLTHSTNASAPIIPSSKFSYKLGQGDGGTFNPYAGAVAKTFNQGAVNAIDFALKLNPGWSHEGGVYTGTVTITATQL